MPLKGDHPPFLPSLFPGWLAEQVLLHHRLRTMGPIHHGSELPKLRAKGHLSLYKLTISGIFAIIVKSQLRWGLGYLSIFLSVILRWGQEIKGSVRKGQQSRAFLSTG